MVVSRFFRTLAKILPPDTLPWKRMDSATETYLTVREAANLLGIHISTMRKWTRTGLVPIAGHRGALRIRLADILPRSRQPHPTDQNRVHSDTPDK